MPPILLPTLSWTVIRVGRYPGDIYVKTKFGYWLEAKTGKDISDADLTYLVNEKIVWFSPEYHRSPRGYQVLSEQPADGEVEEIPDDLSYEEQYGEHA